MRNFILTLLCKYDAWQTKRLCKAADEFFAPIHIGSELHTVVIPEDLNVIDSTFARGPDGDAIFSRMRVLASQSPEPTDEELLEEAHAWGFDNVADWMAAMDQAYLEAEGD